MTLRELTTGDVFYFAEGKRAGSPYRYHGNGWFGWPYSGGPWHTHDNPRVFFASLEETEHWNQAETA